MKSGWKKTVLNDCLLPYRVAAKVPKKQYMSNGEYPIVSQEVELISGYWNNEGDVNKVSRPLVVFGDHTQVVKLVDFDFVVGADGVKVLCPNEEIEPKFLYYFILAHPIKSLGYARHFRYLKALRLCYPAIDEQKRIVSILDQAFEGLDRARANAEANLECARELFERVLDTAFSIEGQRNQVSAWEYKKLNDVAVISPSKKLAKGKLNDNEFVSFVPMDHLGILQTNFSPKEDRLLSEVYSDYTYFEDGDVLIAKITPCFENGKMGIAKGMTNGVGFGSSEFVPLRSSGSIIPKFLFYYLRRDKFRRHGAQVMTGAVGHKRVPKDYIENLIVPVPILDEQQRIISQLDEASRSIDAMCAKYTSKLSDLGDLRQSLLEKAFAGELT